MFTRRKILKLIAGAPAMALIPPAFAAVEPLRRPIPKTGELLHAVGLGTWQTFDVGGDTAGRAAAGEVLARFVKSGGRMVDSSPMYASSESVVGDLFRRVKGRELPGWAEEFDCNSWARFFLKYILGHPAVTCAIPATRNPDYLVDNMGAALGRLPDAAMRRRMVQHVRSL